MESLQMLNMTPQMTLIFALTLPLLAALMASISKNENIRELTTIALALATFINVISLLLMFNNNDLQRVSIAEIVPGIDIAFNIDGMGMLFALVASFLWLVTSIYSIGYMRGNGEAHQNRFYCFFAIAIFSALGIAFSANLFTMFFFYEVMTISTFPLVAHSGTRDAKRAGRVYLGILLSTSILFQFSAIVWTFLQAGTVEFGAVPLLAGKISPTATGILLLLYVYGVGKLALMPLHRWLPAAMVAPTPVSALLHAVAVVKAGVFCLTKIIIYVFGVEWMSQLTTVHWWSGAWLPWLASITIILASITALRQDEFKKRLAYSTISQLAYAGLAVGLFGKAGIIAAIFHIAAHAVGKITLFFGAGAVYTASGKKNIHQLGGIGKRMPFTMVMFSVGVISMIGLPPAAGFITKFYLLQASVEVSPYFAVILVVSTMLNAAYFLPIIYMAFFGKEDKRMMIKGHKEHGEAPLPILIAMGITSFLVVALFLYPDLLLDLAQSMVR